MRVCLPCIPNTLLCTNGVPFLPTVQAPAGLTHVNVSATHLRQAEFDCDANFGHRGGAARIPVRSVNKYTVRHGRWDMGWLFRPSSIARGLRGLVLCLKA